MLGISEAAQYIGFDTVGVKMTFEQLEEYGVFPCILHWNQNHFVVCSGIEKQKIGGYKIRISDPASQRLSYTREEFSQCWIGPNADKCSCGVALMLEPGDNFGKVEDEYRKNSRGLLSFARYFTPYRSMIGQLLLAMLLGSLIQMVLPFLSQAMVDQGVNGRNLNVITLIPGSPHFIPLRFFLDNPHYRHYWFIEYDVVFTGRWSTLMEDCDSILGGYDFLSCHIERFGEDNRQWPWWYRSNDCGYALEECVKGFNPICRYSNRALALLDSYMREGHSAHSEVMITTCLHNHGMKIGDIGGTSEFTPDGYRNRYYIKGVGTNNGTMRWRPPFTMEEIEALGTKDRLFHPVK